MIVFSTILCQPQAFERLLDSSFCIHCDIICYKYFGMPLSPYSVWKVVWTNMRNKLYNNHKQKNYLEELATTVTNQLDNETVPQSCEYAMLYPWYYKKHNSLNNFYKWIFNYIFSLSGWLGIFLRDQIWISSL